MTINPVTYTNFLQVPYSDLPNLLAIAVIIVAWQAYLTKPHWGSLVVLGLASLLGQLIKPSLIVLVPVLLLTFLLVGRGWQKQLISPVVTVLVAVALTVPVKGALLSLGHYQNHDRYRLPATSWIYMSYLKETGGQYNSRVVEKEETLPNVTTRQEYVTHALVNQLRELGLGGILAQWGRKLTNLTNERHVPIEYRAGVQVAPAHYLAHARILGQFQKFLLQFDWLLLLALALRKIILARLTEPRAVLLVVWAVGLVAFEVFLWEVEDRYGLALIPFLIGVASLPARPSRSLAWWPLVGAVGALLMLINTAVPNSICVATQQSALSIQYHERPVELAPKHRLSQAVTLNHAVTRARVWRPRVSRVRIWLVTPQGKWLALTGQGSLVEYRGRLAAGIYRIVVENKTAYSQPVWCTTWENGRLAPHPLVVDHQVRTDQSLRYQFNDE